MSKVTKMLIQLRDQKRQLFCYDTVQFERILKKIYLDAYHDKAVDNVLSNDPELFEDYLNIQELVAAFDPDPRPIKREPKARKPIAKISKKRLELLAKGAIIKKAYKIKPVSEKRKAENKIYSALRKEYLTNFPYCQYKGCGKVATDIHHKAKRGINLNNVHTWISVCRDCHNVIHDQNIKL